MVEASDGCTDSSQPDGYSRDIRRSIRPRAFTRGPIQKQTTYGQGLACLPTQNKNYRTAMKVAAAPHSTLRREPPSPPPEFVHVLTAVCTPPIDGPINQPIIRRIDEPINHSISQSPNQYISRPIKSTNTSTNQSINQATAKGGRSEGYHAVSEP